MIVHSTHGPQPVRPSGLPPLAAWPDTALLLAVQVGRHADDLGGSLERIPVNIHTSAYVRTYKSIIYDRALVVR